MKKLMAVLAIFFALASFSFARTKTMGWQGKEAGEKIPKWVKKFDNEKKVASILKIDRDQYEIFLVTRVGASQSVVEMSPEAYLRSFVASKKNTEELELLQKKTSFWVHYKDTKSKKEYYQLYIVGTQAKNQ